MKPSIIALSFLLLVLSHTTVYGQEDVTVSLGLNTAGIAPNGGSASAFPGIQFGIGTEIPTSFPFYIAPSLWVSQGGQVFRNGDFRSGIRNTYVQLSTCGGYAYELDEQSSLCAEIGPTINLWASGTGFDNFSGDIQRNKFDIGSNEAANRVFVSGTLGAAYKRTFGSYEVSAGIRVDLGLTPIESVDIGNGETERFRTTSVALVGGFSYPIDELVELVIDDTATELILTPEDLIVQTPYDEAVSSFQKARGLVDDAYTDEPSETLPPEIAQGALAELEKTKKLLEAGKAAWDNGDNDGIGPEAAKLLTQYIEELETRARVMADSTWIVEVPIEDDGDDPTDTPPPTIYGEEITPPWITVEGAMAPSQAVWQDDEFFADKPTKQISQQDPNRWHAELDMVSNRWTAVFGLKKDRHTIYMTGKTTYSQSVPVKFRLKLIQGGGEKVIWTQEKSQFSVPMAGEAGRERSWRAYLYGADDAPVPRTFKMEPGPYTLELELIKEDGSETGLKLITYGEVVETKMPKVYLVPVLLTDEWTTAEGREVADHAKRIAEECSKQFYAYLPVQVGGVDISAEAIQFLGSQELGTLDYLVSLLPGTDTHEEVRKDRLIAKLVQRFATTAQLGGAGRVVIVINEGDFARIYRRHEKVAGFAPHPKVQIIRMDEHAPTVAHELIHSFPYLWSSDAMKAACGFSYHNSDDNDYGNGVEVQSYGAFYRDRRSALMGSGSILAFITQCSYWHLTQQFQQGIDPPLYLVRGFLAQQEGQFYGALSPTYEFEGMAGLTQGAIAPDGWGIVLRDAQAHILGSYPFEAEWQDPDELVPRLLIPLNVRIDRLPGTARIELVGPGGVKATQLISPNRPTVEIAYPKNGSILASGKKGINIQWKGTDLDKDKLQYWVQYSLDAGKNWIPLGDEIQATSVAFPSFERAKQVLLRVYATDGVLSDMQEVSFYVTP